MSLDTLKQELSLYRRYLPDLDGEGDHYHARCRFHSDTSPSLDVDRKPNGAWLWVCRSGDSDRCKTGGSIIDLVIFLRGLNDEGEAIRELQGFSGNNGNSESARSETEQPKEAKVDFAATVATHVEPSEKALADSQEAQAYLAGRGIIEDVWQDLRFGFTPKHYFRGTKCKKEACPLCGYYPAIVIPHFWDGVLIGVKYRALNAPDKWHRFTQEKGSQSDFLYNAEASPRLGSLTTIYFEGEMDCALALSLGFNAIAGIGISGIPLPEKQSDRFSKSVLKIKTNFDRLLLIGDMDKAGDAARRRLNSIFGGFGILCIDLPADKSQPGRTYNNGRILYPRFKDITTMYQAKGEDAVRKHLEWAVEHVENEDHHYPTFRGSDEHRLRRVLEQASSRVFDVEPKVLIQTVQRDLQGLFPPEEGFPAPLSERSLHGIVGEFVKTGLPFTNADEACLAYQFLAAVGNAMGKNIYGKFGEDTHYPHLYALIVGDTTAGKGGALNQVKSALSFDESWKANCRYSAASGEGLVAMLGEVASASEGRSPRMCLIMPEIALVLNSSNRKDSNTGAYLRLGYDNDPLENNRSQEQIQVSDYSLGLFGHITPDELSNILGDVDWYNGLANRFIWAMVRPSKNLDDMDTSPDFSNISASLKHLLGLPPVGQIHYSTQGREAWRQWRRSRPVFAGKLAAGCRRADANAYRLAVLYAALDERRLTGLWSPMIEPVHVSAATELVDRSCASIKWFLERPVKVSEKKNDWENMFKFRKALNEKHRLTGTDLKELFRSMKDDERRDLATRAGAKFRPSNMGQPGSGYWTW